MTLPRRKQTEARFLNSISKTQDNDMNKILFLDTVTTGMGPEINRYGIYRFGGIYTEDGVEKERFEFKLRPFSGARMVDSSLWITGESRSGLIYCEDEASAFARFTDLLDRHVNVKNAADKICIAGFNAMSVDIPFLKEMFKRNSNPHFRDYFRYQGIELMSVCALALMKNRVELPNFHLDIAARTLGILPTRGEQYSCIDSAKTCLDMYRKLSIQFGLEPCRDLTVTHNLTKNF